MLTSGHCFLSKLSKSLYSRAFDSSTTLSALKLKMTTASPSCTQA